MCKKKIISAVVITLMLTGAPLTTLAEKQNPSKQKPAERWKKLQEQRALVQKRVCDDVSRAKLSIQLIKGADSFRALSEYVTDTKQKISDMASKLEISDFETGHSNFSIAPKRKNHNYNQSEQNKYQLSGTLSFSTLATEKALGIAEALDKDGLRVTYNEHTKKECRYK